MNNDFMQLCKEVQQMRPELKIKHGGSGGAPFKTNSRPSPMKILKNWIEDNQMRLLDLFNTLDKDKSMNITVKEFADGLKVRISLKQEIVHLSCLFVYFVIQFKAEIFLFVSTGDRDRHELL